MSGIVGLGGCAGGVEGGFEMYEGGTGDQARVEEVVLVKPVSERLSGVRISTSSGLMYRLMHFETSSFSALLQFS